MQTFMPYSDFRKVARCLDNKRLGKQRVEAWQIYKTIRRMNLKHRILHEDPVDVLGIKWTEEMKKKYIAKLKLGWRNHPIVKMWKGFEDGLCYYGICMCNEWKKRGYVDNLWIKFFLGLSSLDHNEIPEWVFDKELNKSHQSNLVRKFPEHYRKYFPKVQDNIPYKWIKHEEEHQEAEDER